MTKSYQFHTGHISFVEAVHFWVAHMLVNTLISVVLGWNDLQALELELSSHSASHLLVV